MKRGYFAVKLTDIRFDALGEYLDLYDAVAERLSMIDGFTLHAPHRLTNPNSAIPDGLSPADVYLLDRMHVSHADVLVACLELPSFGVGMELQLASDLGIPVAAFYYKEALSQPSRIVLGLPVLRPDIDASSDSSIIRYDPSRAGRTELLRMLTERVTGILDLATARHHPPTTRISFRLNAERLRQGLSSRELANKAHVPVGLLEQIALAGPGLSHWLQQSHIQAATTLDATLIDEDLVLLPSRSVTARIAAALGITENA